MTEELNQQLIALMLPEGILEYFNVVSFEQVSSGKYVYNKRIVFHLEEKNIIPEEYKGYKHKASGFLPAREVEDCAIRSSLVTLSIKRRRWDVEIDGKLKKVSRDWSLVEDSTRMSAEYAAFFKEISRY
ncbi:MAG: hypothetical protein ACK5LR_00260 [Mangrovibacterium sp.]